MPELSRRASTLAEQRSQLMEAERTYASCSEADAPLQELDTTLQVLGIDGGSENPASRVTASPHAPLLDASTDRTKPKPTAALEQKSSSRLR